MATANTLSVVPSPVPDGQTATVTVSFTLDPGTPDKVASVQLTNGGVVEQSASGVVLKGRPAESAPSVSVGQTGVGRELRTDQGTLTQTGPLTFALRY